MEGFPSPFLQVFFRLKRSGMSMTLLCTGLQGTPIFLRPLDLSGYEHCSIVLCLIFFHSACPSSLVRDRPSVLFVIDRFGRFFCILNLARIGFHGDLQSSRCAVLFSTLPPVLYWSLKGKGLFIGHSYSSSFSLCRNFYFSLYLSRDGYPPATFLCSRKIVVAHWKPASLA